MSKGRRVEEMGETNFYVNKWYLKVWMLFKISYIYFLSLGNKFNCEFPGN